MRSNDTLVCCGFLLLMRKNWTPSEARGRICFWPAAAVAHNVGLGGRLNFPFGPVSWLFFFPPFKQNLHFISCERSFSSFCLPFCVREKFPGSFMKIMGPFLALTLGKILSLAGIGWLRKSHFSALPLRQWNCPGFPAWAPPSWGHWSSLPPPHSFLCPLPLATHSFSFSTEETHQVACLLWIEKED